MLTTVGRERQQQLSMMLSDYGRGRLLAYADSFRELSRSYRGEPGQGICQGASRQQILEERRLWENRQVICDNLEEMSQIMAKLAAEVFRLTPLPPREEKLVIRALKQEGITVLDLFYIDQPEREDAQREEPGQEEDLCREEQCCMGATLGLHIHTQRMIGRSTQEVADMLSVLLGRRLTVSVTSPPQIEEREGTYLFVEEPRFVVLSGSARAVFSQ